MPGLPTLATQAVIPSGVAQIEEPTAKPETFATVLSLRVSTTYIGSYPAPHWVAMDSLGAALAAKRSTGQPSPSIWDTSSRVRVSNTDTRPIGIGPTTAT